MDLDLYIIFAGIIVILIIILVVIVIVNKRPDSTPKVCYTSNITMAFSDKNDIFDKFRQSHREIDFTDCKIMLGIRSHAEIVGGIELKSGRCINPPYALWPKWEDHGSYVTIESINIPKTLTINTAFQCFPTALDTINVSNEEFLGLLRHITNTV